MISRLTFLTVFVSASAFAQPEVNSLPLMPWPASISTSAGSLPIDTSFSISLAGAGTKDSRVQAAVQRTFERISAQTGIPVLAHVVPENGTLQIVVEQRDHRPPQRLGDDEEYSLDVTNGHARLSTNMPLGVLRGLETFLQLIEQNKGPNAASGFSVPGVSIHDEPRFEWRGLSLDVSRHFIPADDVKRTIDGLAAVKCNVLHWHLSDDQGFRIESRKFPRLQQQGSDGLFYTQSQVREIVAYARDRGVRIVPEFDMPGHATSWLPGYPKLGSRNGEFQIVRGSGIMSDLIDPTSEYTYRFLDTFIGEMASLFPDEYFHIGGDEVNPKEWNQNPRIQKFMHKHHLADGRALQVYFNQRVLKIVTRRHKRMIGWDEVLQPDLPKSVVIQSWRGQESLWQAAREGYQGILSAGYYLDLMNPASYHYSVDPMKAPPAAPGHTLPPNSPPPGTPANLSPDQSRLILGGEAAMWEELATAENLDSRLWPRIAAIAERFWSPEPITDVPSMYRRLAFTDDWLEWLGLNQRTNLEKMRERLAAGAPVHELDVFASILEPVKGYERHAEGYSMLTPFNRLVDAIPPESPAAREFRNAVDEYLAGPKSANASEQLRTHLTAWWENAVAVRPTLESNSLLHEDIPVADAITTLCKAGLDAIAGLDSKTPPAADWKSSATDAVTKASKPHADLLVQIAPGIEKLISAVPAPQQSH